MKKRVLPIFILVLSLLPCFGFSVLAASDLGSGYYSNQQLEDQFGKSIPNMMHNYAYDAITVSFSPVMVYFATNSANNTREIETSYMEMNLTDIQLQPGQKKTLHLSGTDTVSEGGQWEDKYTIQRDFEADVTLYIEPLTDQKDSHNLNVQVENIAWTNTMDRFPSSPSLTVLGAEETLSGTPQPPPAFLINESPYPYPYGVMIYLEPEEAMHRNTARATFMIYVTAVKPSAETLALLGGTTGTTPGEDPDPADNPNAPGNGTDQIIDTEADKTPGESEFTVFTAIVLGVAATAASLAGAGVAASAAGSAGDKSVAGTEDGSFQMIIGKDFADALKYGKKQRVWARMMELRKGVPIDRPDLTAEISIFSNEVLVGAASQRGSNMEAEVQIQENAPPEGVISFQYNGGRGLFQNNVHFRLLGKGVIKLVSDKVSLLSTDDKPYELVYELENFTEDEPPLEITASSGVVALDIGKNDKQQTVVRITPGPDADPWDRKSFTKICRCEMTVMDGMTPVKALFEVTVCFEGIGTAFANLPIDELPDDALIECFSDAEKEKREEKALWISLTVMKWDDKRRVLEPDVAKADALAFGFEVHPDFEFKTPESKALAERVVTKANIETRVLPAPPTLQIDRMKKPSAYRLLAAQDPDEGAAPFDIRMTVSCQTDSALDPLALKAQIKPNPDFKGMVRWFLEYPLGSAAADFITLGNVATYHGALDFIESRVYPLNGVPWSANLLWNRDENSHYEHGRLDMMRASYIAIKDHMFPKNADAGEFKKVQTLVHELTHVIEDQHGDYKANAKSERHAYYLQHLSDIAMGLTDMERAGVHCRTDVWYAIHYGYWLNVEPLIIGDIGNIGPWFGGEMKLSVHELFDKYAYHTDTLGGRMDDAQRQAVAQEFQRWYFPGNLSEVDLHRGVPSDAIGRFTDTDGPFKDTEWKFVWNQGVLQSIEATHSDYLFTVENYRWTGGNELKLQLEIKVQEKANSSTSYDFLSATFDGGTFNTAARSFPRVRSFVVHWRSLNEAFHSLLFTKTGSSEATTLLERKK